MDYSGKFYKFIFNLDESLVEGIIHVRKADLSKNLVWGPAFYFRSFFNEDNRTFTLVDNYTLDIKDLAEETDKKECDILLLDTANRFRGDMIEQQQE